MSQIEKSTAPSVGVVRLPIDKPQLAVDFLHARGGGVMDLIAHFWDRLPQTPPLSRADLHLVIVSTNSEENTYQYYDTLKQPIVSADITGAMLYVPKAHRADVLASDAPAAEAFSRYIATAGAAEAGSNGHLEDTQKRTTPIDFLTGAAAGIQAMIPHLLPLVNKRVPARQVVNHVMQLPDTAKINSDPHVRMARDGDMGTLNRWRTMYKQERGILFDADVDAWVQSGRVFIYDVDGKPVALAKFDMDLANLIEIGGVFTFPEHRRQGYGGKLVMDLAQRIRSIGKTPLLQVDTENDPALHLYQRLGWKNMGQLARVWLTG